MAPTLENTIPSCQTNQQKGKQKTTMRGGDITDPIESKTVAPVGGFKVLLNKLERAFSRSKSSVDVDEVWRILEEYNSKPEEWAKYAYYDMTKYKRNLVAEYDKYNVMIITWGPGTRSCIHDHAGSHCFMKVIDGELIEGRFARPDEKTLSGAKSQEMLRIRDTRMRMNDVVYIHDKVGLHLVENVNQIKTAASLHVYIPPYRECKAFDQRTGRAIDCKLKFYSKCGRVIKEDEELGSEFEC